MDVTTGIELAVKKVLEHAGIDHGSDQILSLTIGTTVGFFLLYPGLNLLKQIDCLALYQCDCAAGCDPASKSGRHSTRSALYH